MHILVTGGTGFIGSALVPSLLADGHQVTILTRGRARDGGCAYINSLDELAADTALDAVVNLAGASLAGRRWTAAYKREIITSRIGLTESLIAFFNRLEQPPQVLVSASAVGFYGHQGDDILNEDSPVEPGFSQDLCERWEAAALQAEELQIRVCLPRLGVVLDREGGAMEQMARPFRLGIANWLGSGDQWLSWVHRADVVGALRMFLVDVGLRGPFNVTAPEPVTSRGFCAAMKARHRTLITAPVPAAVMRLMVGEMADELLLNGQRVVPARLLAAGFEFSFPTLDKALVDIY